MHLCFLSYAHWKRYYFKTEVYILMWQWRNFFLNPCLKVFSFIYFVFLRNFHCLPEQIFLNESSPTMSLLIYKLKSPFLWNIPLIFHSIAAYRPYICCTNNSNITQVTQYPRKKDLGPYSISGPSYVSEEKLLNSHISISSLLQQIIITAYHFRKFCNILNYHIQKDYKEKNLV